jgi:hypothetical protein
MTRFQLIPALVVLPLAAACGSGTNGSTQSADSQDSGGASVCGTHANVAAEFGPTMKSTGAVGYTVELIQAAPTEPSSYGANDWKLKVTDPSGTPLGTSATVVVKCGMPGHTHGCGGDGAQVAALGNGEFDVSQMVFVMQGYWIIQVFITDGATSDTVNVDICVQ